MPREWDASTYDRIPMPHLQWGARTLARLQLHGTERVLDAGCGTGRVTEQLLQALPGGSVVAVDASRAMLDQLRERLRDYLTRVEVVHSDLLDPLPLSAPVDAVLSTATFHWVLDHGRLFRNIFDCLLPGGQFVAECGGAGNIAGVQRALSDLGYTHNPYWNFANPSDTVRRLEVAGFEKSEAWLYDDHVRIPEGPALETYLRTVVLGAHLDPLSEPERTELVRAVARRLDGGLIDYVRLNIGARRPLRKA